MAACPLPGRRPAADRLESRYVRFPSPALAGITGALRESTVAMISELSMPCR